MSVLDHFELDEREFWFRDGPARARGDERCHIKLCFSCTTVEPLAALLYDLSLRDDCWYVKLDSFHRTRNGIIRGRCFLTNEEQIAKLWTIHKHTDVVTCSVQDDRFADPRRDPNDGASE